jgi:putative solute:sodium symporter small subunit
MASSKAHAEHWERTRRLTFITLGIWFFFSFFIHWFGAELNNLSFMGFPLGFYMAAQGSPLAFVILLFWSTRKQEAIDEECGVAE